MISTFNSLTLSPALCAVLLRPRRERTRAARLGPDDLAAYCLPFTFLGELFNRGFAASGRGYVKVVGFGLRVPLLVLAGYLAIVGAGCRGYSSTMPTGFIPQQDKGYLIGSIQLPDAASAERTRPTSTSRRVESAIARGSCRDGRTASGKSTVQPGEARQRGRRATRSCSAPTGRTSARCSSSSTGSTRGGRPKLYRRCRSRRNCARSSPRPCPEAQVNVFGAPAVPRLGPGRRVPHHDRGPRRRRPGRAPGPDRTTSSRRPTSRSNWSACSPCSRRTRRSCSSTSTAARARSRARSRRRLRHAPGYLGSRYVNDFNRFGRTWQVNVQADAEVPQQLEDVQRLKVRNTQRRDGAAGRGARASRS